jgi:hypothetical protein
VRHLVLAHDLRQANAFRASRGLPPRDTHNVVTHLWALRDAGPGVEVHVLAGWDGDRPAGEVAHVRALLDEARRRGAEVHI